MNELEKEIKRTFHSLTGGLEPSPVVKQEILTHLVKLNKSYTLFIRIPVIVSFFTTIMAVPISVY